MKRFVSIILSLFIVLSIIPTFAVSANAGTEDESCGKKVNFILDKDTGNMVIYSSNSGSMTDFNGADTVPVWYNNRSIIKSVAIFGSVKNIGSYAFEGCNNLEVLYMPTNVLTIGENAFAGCDSLSSVVYSNSQEQLDAVTVGAGNEAFTSAAKTFYACSAGKDILWSYNDGKLDITGFGDMYDLEEYEPGWKTLASSVTTVNVSNGITNIADYAFSEMSSLVTAYIPNTVTALGVYSFDSTALTDIYIPASVQVISPSAFNALTDAFTVHYGGNEEMWNAINIDSSNTDILSVANMLYCQGVTGDNVQWKLADIEGLENGKELVITGTGDMYNYDDYTKAPWSALASSIIYINIKNGVTSIGAHSFDKLSSMISLVIPASVETIDNTAFGSMPALKEYQVSEDNTHYANDFALIDVTTNTFIAYPQAREAEEYKLPDGVTTINSRAFAGNKNIKSITIPLSVNIIGDDAFADCDSLSCINYNGCNTLFDKIDVGNNGDMFSAITVNYADHDYNAGVVTKKATCTSTGVKTYTCKVCNVTKTESIPKLAHAYKTYTTRATTSKNGSVVTKCTVCGAVKSKSTIYYPKTVTLSATSYTYDGKVKKPSVKVVGSNGKTISSSNYTISYASGRKNVGKYAVKVTFKGKYSGTKTLYFTIKPKATSISSLAAKSKGFTVKWYRRSTQTTGYQVQYSTSSKFTSPKTYTISGTSTISKSFSKLTAKKRYYVRVRTYKTVNGTRYYSSWSKARYVTTKS
ncbi:MAG: leucine-rich repeat protein [Eubacteriales bacterium]|nr:leucine-rich repeat protein [Eubacteriales bacterium]